MANQKSAYTEAGVNIDAAAEAVKRITAHVRSTCTPQTLTGVGSFGGLLDISFIKTLQNPVLVHTTDGVGTKMMVAEMMNCWTVGQDIVHHCVNDVVAMGALPLAFLDYIGTAKLEPEKMEQIIRHMAEACRELRIPLISGEMAEMPGVYRKGRHDIVGCVTGIAERNRIIDGSKITAGDVLIGLPSSGLHTNGYSLARRVFFETAKYKPDTYLPELGCTVGEELLKVHRCYCEPIICILRKGIEIHGIAHITGGGFFANIGRLLPKRLQAEISHQWKIPPVFRLIQKIGRISDHEMRRVFNLGVGMVLIAPSAHFSAIKKHLEQRNGLDGFLIGVVKKTFSEVKVVFTY